jgi:Helix-turn-helix domain
MALRAAGGRQWWLVGTPTARLVLRLWRSRRGSSEEEQLLIADLHRLGLSIPAIARKMGRAASTISRELRRNADPTSGAYHPYAAHRRTASRLTRPRPGKLAIDAELRAMVQELLDRRRSPEQPDSPTRRRDHSRRGDAAGQPARRRCPPDRQGTARAAGRVWAQGPNGRQRTTALSWITLWSTAIHPMRRNWPPRRTGEKAHRAHARHGTADRGYGEATVD